MTYFGEDPSIRAISLLRGAARELLPIVVDMGPDQAKYSSFISSVRDHGRGIAVLDPIAADALPAVMPPFSIVPAGGPADWSISATRLWREGGRRACVDLACARVLDGDARETTFAVQTTDLLVLVVPGDLHDASYVFPVQRIGAQVCEIRCSVPFSIGAELGCVELVGDRRLLRRAAAQVLDVVPWYMPDGSRSFSCRLSLSERSIEAAGAYDLVIDPAEVRRLLHLAESMHASCWFEAPGHGLGTLQWRELGKDYALLALSPTAKTSPEGSRGLRVGMELFDIAYEFDVRLLECSQGLLRTSLPLILRRRRRHRRDQRIPVDATLDVQLSFRNPVTGAVQVRRVTELSFYAVRFECEAHTAVLWRGLPLEQAHLAWGKRLIHLGDLVVEQTSYDATSAKARCVASIPHSSIPDDPALISLMATLAHPQVRAHDGIDFSALHRTYVKAGLFGSHMHRNLDPIVEQTKRVWRKAHCEAADVVRTFVHGPADAPDAALTVMRAWEHGWVSQHFVDTSPELHSGAGKLQHACLDHLVPRPDGRYMLFFVKTDNRLMNAYLRRFFSFTGTPDAVTRVTVELWARRETITGIPPPPETTCELRSCGPGEELIVARAAQRCLGAHAAAALSFRPGELLLPDTRRRFGKAGLERDRECDLVLRDGEPIYAVVEERSTPGMNLTWMLNACWIIPIHPELDPDAKALDRALRSVVDRPAQTPTGERFLNLPEGIDPASLQRWGFAKEASVYLYVLTRAGVHRLFTYATSRYGEVDALAARRDGRRSKLELEP